MASKRGGRATQRPKLSKTVPAPPVTVPTDLDPELRAWVRPSDLDPLCSRALIAKAKGGDRHALKAVVPRLLEVGLPEWEICTLTGATASFVAEQAAWLAEQRNASLVDQIVEARRMSVAIEAARIEAMGAWLSSKGTEIEERITTREELDRDGIVHTLQTRVVTRRERAGDPRHLKVWSDLTHQLVDLNGLAAPARKTGELPPGTPIIAEVEYVNEPLPEQGDD